MTKPNMYYILKSKDLKVIDIVEEVITNVLNKCSTDRYLLIIGTGYFGEDHTTIDVMDKMGLINCGKSFDVLLIGDNYYGQLLNSSGGLTKFGKTMKLFAQEGHYPYAICKRKHHSKYFFILKLDQRKSNYPKNKVLSGTSGNGDSKKNPKEISENELSKLLTEIINSTAVMYYGGSSNFNRYALMENKQDESDIVLVNEFVDEVFTTISEKIHGDEISKATIIPGIYVDAFNTGKGSMDDVIKDMAKIVVNK